MPDSKTMLENIITDLQQQGWSVQKNFIPAELVQQLNETLQSLRQQGKLQQAGIGRKADFHIEQSIRNDQISWFGDSLEPAQQQYMDLMEQLKQAVNQHFYLGLFELEVHFALYAPNAYYKRHLDQHRDQDTRQLTVIAYLNENWLAEDGGELQLYLPGEQSVKILPEAGTFVCFFSAEYEHEVLPAKRERASLTGWFRKRPELPL